MSTSVYLISCPHSVFSRAVKVGVANNVPARMKELQTGSAEDFELLFAFKFDTRPLAFKVEQEFHRTFDHARIRGEWFGISDRRALFLLTQVVIKALTQYRPAWDMAQARRDANLLAAFDILDRASPEEQQRWAQELEEVGLA